MSGPSWKLETNQKQIYFTIRSVRLSNVFMIHCEPVAVNMRMRRLYNSLKFLRILKTSYIFRLTMFFLSLSVSLSLYRSLSPLALSLLSLSHSLVALTDFIVTDLCCCCFCCTNRNRFNHSRYHSKCGQINWTVTIN